MTVNSSADGSLLMRPNILVVLLLTITYAAAAQPGPAPGYDSALEYAQDYASSQAENASADPVAYGQEHATEEALRNDTSHAVYMACWAADDHGVQHDACDPYYTPRGHEPPSQPPEPPCQCNASQAPNSTLAYLNGTANATTDHLGNASALANATLDDPGNATHHVLAFALATVHFVRDVAVGAVALAVAVLHGILECLGISLRFGASLLGLAGGGIAALAALLLDTIRLGGVSVAGAGQAAALAVVGAALALGQAIAAAGATTVHALVVAVHAVADGALASVGAIAAGFVAVGHGLASAASAVGDALVTAGKATGHAFQAAGDAMADAARSIKDAVTGIFDGGAAASDGLDPVGKGVDAGKTTDGLLGGVKDLL